MKSKLFFLLLFFIAATALHAQEESTPDSLKAWKTSGRVGVNFSNVSLTNWAGGGQESVSGTGEFVFNADYKKNNKEWKNSIELGYGLIKQGNDPVIKSDDKIILVSTFNYSFKPKWSFSNVLSFRSQFAPGYNPPEVQNDTTKISDWLAPGYIQEAIGIEYKPNEFISFMLSPATYKLTIVMDQQLANQGAFGVEAADTAADGTITRPGENIRHELGASFRMIFKKEVFKNVDFESQLDLFSNYFENPDAIDVNWANNLNMKINNFMTASILTQLVYDDDIKIAASDNPNDIAPRTQFKSVLGIGVNYKF
jgi:hypothetical protein